MSFTPIHESPLGWSSDGFSTSDNKNFPYNIDQSLDYHAQLSTDKTSEPSYDGYDPDIEDAEDEDAGTPDWASALEENAKAATADSTSGEPAGIEDFF